MLEGVVKQGARAQHTSQTTEIWKGRYDAKVVALKVFVVPRGDPHEHRARNVRMLCGTSGGISSHRTDLMM